MKITAIAALCKQEKTLHIYDTPKSGQFIGNGSAAYAVDGLPPIDVSEALVVFDIPLKQAQEWDTECIQSDEFDFSDTVPNEVLCECLPINISFRGVDYIPVQSESGAHRYIDADLLKPLKWYRDAGVIGLFARTNAKGDTYFAVKAGFLLKAIIMPINPAKDMTDLLKCLVKGEKYA